MNMKSWNGRHYNDQIEHQVTRKMANHSQRLECIYLNIKLSSRNTLNVIRIRRHRLLNRPPRTAVLVHNLRTTTSIPTTRQSRISDFNTGPLTAQP